MLSIWHWHTEPLLIGGILVFVWLYGMLVGPLRAWVDPEVLFPRREVAWFAVAVISFYLAVGSPLDAAGENFLFSAHMVQHNILMYVTAAFGVLALPGWLVDGLLDRAPRFVVRSLRFWLHPLVAGFTFTFVFSGWHAPVLYEWALHDKAAHAFEHLTMLLVSVMMFWPLLSRSRLLPASPWGVHVLYLFVLMVAQIPLFGILTFAEYPLYPTYEFAPRVIPWLNPLEDQVLGGLLMKVANMIVSLVFIARAFVLWNAQAKRVDRRGRRAKAALAL